jgi:hypothetical protein
MRIKNLGYMAMAVLIAGMVGCATPPPPEPVPGPEVTQIEDAAKLGTIEFTSTPSAVGKRIEVYAGGDVVVNLTAEGATSITANNTPGDSVFESSGSTATLTWKTTSRDARVSSHRVSFEADNGGTLTLTIVVLMNK